MPELLTTVAASAPCYREAVDGRSLGCSDRIATPRGSSGSGSDRRVLRSVGYQFGYHAREAIQKVKGGALADDGKSARTQHHARAILRRALRRAETLGLVARNVAALVDSPKQGGHKTDDTMTADEARLILSAAADRRIGWDDAKSEDLAPDDLHALAVVLLTLGLRKGEALALRWSDVDLEDDELTVRHTIKFRRKGGGWYLTAPKTDDSARTIPLPAFVTDALRDHRRAQTERRLATPVWNDHDFVFPTSVGTPIHSRNATRWWHGLLERAGVERRRMHATRHTAATLLLEDGVPLEVVSAILGHSSLAITADIYARVGKDSMRRALSNFDHLATSLATGTE